MRTVTYGAACSVDGFIAGPDEAMDWLTSSKDAQRIMAEYWTTIDTMLLGRRTFEYALKAGGGGGGRFEGMTTYLFSRTLTASPDPSAILVREDAGGFVRELKRQEGKGICVMSGGNLARSLFEAGVIDQVGLNIHPVLLGSGTPLFLDPGRRVQLALTECRPIEGGCVYLMYRVTVRGS